MHIKEYMLKKNLSIQDMADLSDSSRSMIVNLRAGKIPSARTARKISKATDGIVSVEDLLNPPLLWIDDEKKNELEKAG